MAIAPWKAPWKAANGFIKKIKGDRVINSNLTEPLKSVYSYPKKICSLMQVDWEHISWEDSRTAPSFGSPASHANNYCRVSNSLNHPVGGIFCPI